MYSPSAVVYSVQPQCSSLQETSPEAEQLVSTCPELLNLSDDLFDVNAELKKADLKSGEIIY